MILGHRGSPRQAPENTLRSFRCAIDAGADGVELDVRLARTGEVVVGHDATLTRTAHANVRVAATSAWALGRWDLGGGETVPTLDSVFAALPGRFINVEIKHDDVDGQAIARATVECIRRAGRTRSVIVSCFEPRVLDAVRRCDPEIRRGLLVPPDALERADILARGVAARPHAIHPHHSMVSVETVRDWHARGWQVNVWTVDRPTDVARCIEAGVDAIITNVPGEAVDAVGRLGGARPLEAAG